MDNQGSDVTPAYPFQALDRRFYDKPAGPLSTGSFYARALLAKIVDRERTITTYEGVSYQYVLSALAPIPEAGTLPLMLVGLLVLVLLLRRSRQRRAH